MKAIDFNEGWRYRRLEEKGEGIAVAIPHDAMLGEPRTELSAGGINTGWYEGHDYVYTKHFTLEPEYADKTLILEFEGVYHNAEVRLNGTKIASRPYGYSNFYGNCTGHLNFQGDNELTVIARNADQPNSRWYSGAGIYRPVKLWVSDKEHIKLNGVKIKTLGIHPAEIEICVKTVGSGTVKAEILDGEKVEVSVEGQSDGSAVMRVRIPHAKLWSPKTPKLYKCRVSFGTDEVVESFGIRTLTYGEKGICINGERVIIRGACIHHDNGILGACCYPEAEERKIRILLENGYNAVRSAHNPCSKALLDACDRLGVLVMDEFVDCWYIHKTKYDYVCHMEKWWKKDLEDMVDKDYNHPSVILYSTGNEVSETAQERGIKLTGIFTEYLHSLDDTRPVTCGINIFFNFLSSIGFGVYNDEKAQKEAARAEKKQKAAKEGKPKKDKAVGSQFFNNMAGLFGDNFMKMGATLHGCDVKTRDAFANMDIAGYNYGILRYQKDLKKYPKRLILGSETFCKDAYRFWEQAKKEPRIVGDFVWAGMDYLGEVGIGSWEYKDYAPEFDHGPGWVTAGSGRINLLGRPLGEAFYTRVAFEQEKGPFIGVCPVDHTGDRHSPSAWKMSNAMDSWSWEGCEGKPADVEVYARAAKVELFINGKAVGSKAMQNDCIARFRCTYEKGVIEAVSYDKDGSEIGRSSLKTAKEKTCLKAVPEKKSVKSGELCFIWLRYTDEEGTLKPLKRGILQADVTGGELLALGNACPYNELGYVGRKTDTYYGEAMAVVKAGTCGTVSLKIYDGRYRAEVKIPVNGEAQA